MGSQLPGMRKRVRAAAKMGEQAVKRDDIGLGAKRMFNLGAFAGGLAQGVTQRPGYVNAAIF